MWLIIGCKAEELAAVSHTMRTAKPCARSKREPWLDLVASAKAVSTVLSDAGHGLRIKRLQGFVWGSAEAPSVHAQRVVVG
jgi:hypothetical protein